MSNSEDSLFNIWNTYIHLKLLVKELDESDSHKHWVRRPSICNALKNKIIEDIGKIDVENFRHNETSIVENFEEKLKENKKLKRLQRKPSNKLSNRSLIDAKKNVSEEKCEEKKFEDLMQEKRFEENTNLMLADIRLNRTEIKKYFTILKELKKLRKVKYIMTRKEYNAVEADEVFNNIIDSLSQQWAVLNKERVLEERSLKSLIKNKGGENSLTNTTICNEWQEIIFGRDNTEEKNSKTIFDSRNLWDIYLNEGGSEIPTGWILPQESPSPAWAKYINNTD